MDCRRLVGLGNTNHALVGPANRFGIWWKVIIVQNRVVVAGLRPSHQQKNPRASSALGFSLISLWQIYARTLRPIAGKRQQ